MNVLGPYILLGGVVIAVLIWRIGKFLGWEKFYLVWEKFFRKGVIVDGRIWAHRCQRDSDDEGLEQVKPYINAALLTAQLAMGESMPVAGGDKPVQYFLMYTYDCNGTNYLHEEKVDLALYNSLKDGDSVKVRCLPKDPMIAQLEKQLHSRS